MELLPQLDLLSSLGLCGPEDFSEKMKYGLQNLVTYQIHFKEVYFVIFIARYLKHQEKRLADSSKKTLIRHSCFLTPRQCYVWNSFAAGIALESPKITTDTQTDSHSPLHRSFKLMVVMSWFYFYLCIQI